MTTIAADAKSGVMCSDSYWTDGDEVGVMKKVYRIRGELFGFAGDMDAGEEWRKAWRKAGCAPSTEKLAVLRLGPHGISVWDSTNGWLPVYESQFAIGTGGKAARAAMMAGADCKRAVSIVRRIDAGTGGSVRTYRL